MNEVGNLKQLLVVLHEVTEAPVSDTTAVDSCTTAHNKKLRQMP